MWRMQSRRPRYQASPDRVSRCKPARGCANQGHAGPQDSGPESLKGPRTDKSQPLDFVWGFANGCCHPAVHTRNHSRGNVICRFLSANTPTGTRREGIVMLFFGSFSGGGNFIGYIYSAFLMFVHDNILMTQPHSTRRLSATTAASYLSHDTCCLE